MYQVALVDHNAKTPLHRQRFYSCVKLVADQCLPATFYVHANWMRHEFIKDMGWDADQLLDWQLEILEQHNLVPDGDYGDAPYLAALTGEDWKASEKKNGFPARVPERDFVLSESQLINKAQLLSSGLNPHTAILTLAAVGVDLMLPNVNFDLFADEEIDRLKAQLNEERASYLEVISNLAEASYDGLKNGEYTDLVEWANAEAAFKLVPKARAIEVAIQKSNPRTLKTASYSFWRDGIPAIGTAYLTGGLLASSKEASSQALKSIVNAIDRERSEREFPEYSYAMKIAQNAKN